MPVIYAHKGCRRCMCYDRRALILMAQELLGRVSLATQELLGQDIDLNRFVVDLNCGRYAAGWWAGAAPLPTVLVGPRAAVWCGGSGKVRCTLCSAPGEGYARPSACTRWHPSPAVRSDDAAVSI